MAVCCLIVSQAAWADVADLEKDLQTSLEQSGKQVSLAARKLERGLDASPEIARLRNLSENIRITHLLLEERFRLREEKVKTLGSSALSRQQAMAEGYKAALTEYLTLIDSLPAASSQEKINSLKTLLDKLLPKKKRPIIGSLPYKHLNLPPIEPTSAPAITPAYKGGNKTVSTDDTAAVPEAPISKEIAALAQSLNWNPVSIYEYVKNNVETEWYWGCMKGAEDTLHQKSGNDCDQAALLTALFRASGFPTRYVRGVVEFFPDIERAKNLTGIDDPAKIAEFFQKAGIPSKLVIAGGKIANFQIEHIWVESQIPYSNYRGAVIDEHGKAWLGLDTSIKVKGYEYGTAKDLYQEPGVSSQLAGIRDEYLGLATAQTGSTPLELNQTPLEYLQARINSELTTQNTQLTYNDILLTRVLLPENMKILPASLQFGQVKVTNEYAAIPDELKHKMKLSAVSSQQSASAGKLLEITLDVLKLSNQQITLSYEPETVQDQEIINSFGGLDNTPAYLVRLRPVLKVNGERIGVATEGLPMGADYTLTIDLISPSGTETINNTLIVGNLTVIGITAQKAVIAPSPLAREGGGQPSNASIGGEGPKDAERILYETASHYIDRWNASENELASLLQLSITRPLPTVVTLGGVIDVTYLLDMPHGFTWKGVYVDADLRRIETVTRTQSMDARQKLFMQMSSLQGSILENRIFEDDFKVESISTAKLFQLANSQPGTSILTIDKLNIDAILPTLDIAENIKDDIRNSVNQNYAIRIPQSEITYHDWSGIGYIKENPETGESGWMLSGMIAGGSTVDAEWLNNLYLMQVLSAPYAGPKNLDPLAGAAIRKIPATDNQPVQTVDEILAEPLAVAVLDRNGHPVAHAAVSFQITGGGGEIQCLDELGNLIGMPSSISCNTKTSFIYGVARAELRLGKKTSSNPAYRTLVPTSQPDDFPTQVGQNLIVASVTSYSGDLHLERPFEEYAKPDIPEEVVNVLGNGNSAVVNNPLGTLAALVADKHGNPISNAYITFDPTKNTPKELPGNAPLPAGCGKFGSPCRNVEFYNKEECNVPYPLYGECAAYHRTITMKTDHTGARIEAVVGNTVGTQYTVAVSTPTVTIAKKIILQSDGKRDDASSYIFSGIRLGYLENIDIAGNKVNAAKAGESLKQPLSAKLYLYEADIMTEGPVTCTIKSVPTQCWQVIPTGLVKTTPVSGATVTFTPKEGNGKASPTESPLPGIYLSTYTTGSVAAVNRIVAEGAADVEISEVYCDLANKQYFATAKVPPKRSITMKSGQEYAFDLPTGELVHVTEDNWSQTIQYTVYGVGLKLDVEPKITLLDDNGFTTKDRTFTYTITPAEYNALSAYVDLYKTNAANEEFWDGYLSCDQKHGTATEVLSAGEKYDPSLKHTAQLVLNWGTDLEIRGNKTQARIAQLDIKTDDPATTTPVDEIKFGDGSKPNKRYKLELKSADLAASCGDATILTGTIKTILKSGQTPTLQGEGYSPVQHNLTFNPATAGCSVKVNEKEKFVVSNLSNTDLKNRNSVKSDTAVLYGGLGGAELIELSGSSKEVPIEPVGVIVLAIDGLRQDLLYKSTTDDATNEVSYKDSNGCGEKKNCYIEPTELKGLCDVMGGKYDDGIFGYFDSCDPAGWENKHTKLKDVTAIFPSITVASWASVFTGKMPGETGILGNEFFARDLAIKVPGGFDPPAGMITFSSGAFKGYDAFGLISKFTKDFLIPYQLNWKDTVKTENTPQNDSNILKSATVYEMIQKGMPSVESYFTSRGGNATVVANNHYARGASHWLTWDIAFRWGESAIMDDVGWDKFEDYLGDGIFAGKYDKYTDEGLKRNAVPFSAVMTWYLPGLDHEAHGKGMGAYRGYFTGVTDDYVNKLVSRLKKLDEFDNKIFIIVADHGMTAMPEDLTYPAKEKILGSIDVIVPMPAEMECKLKLDFSEPSSSDAPNQIIDAYNRKEAERNNNNLHIWELGEVMRAVGDSGGTQYKVLAPKPIANLYFAKNLQGELYELPYGATSDINKTNVIAALNGPMAHIYLKGPGGWSDENPDIIELTKLAKYMKGYLKDGGALISDKNVKKNMTRLLSSVDRILIRVNGAYRDFIGVQLDANDNVTGPNAATINETYFDANIYVAAFNRIEGMNHPKRSGDIVLIMKDEVDIPVSEIANKRFTTGVACKSWHGSLNRSDSYVPLIVSYPGGNKFEMQQLIDNTQGCNSATGCDGNWRVTDMIKTILQQQYGSQ